MKIPRFAVALLLASLIAQSSFQVYLMPEELDRRFTIYEKNSLNQETQQNEDNSQSSSEVGSRVGICYNLLKSFLPEKDNIFTKIQFESHLHEKINKHELCKDVVSGTVKPFASDKNYIFRQNIDMCETAKIVATYIAYGSTSTYA